jgi:mannose-6-phosphate isomerase-like protein (cupin superfamily)
VLVGFAACGHRAPNQPTVAATGSTVTRSLDSAPLVAEQKTDDERATEQLAAIQFAMGQLEQASRLCWAAAAAVDGFELAGQLKFQIDVATPPSAVAVIDDDTKNPRLRNCMLEVLRTYTYAPPLLGQSIQLPFLFRAPRRQNVIDRRMVPAISMRDMEQLPKIAVLSDERNTGNSAASMISFQLPARTATGLRAGSRSETWYFLSDATMVAGNVTTALMAGDVVVVATDGARNIIAKEKDVHAIVMLTPGGVEGSARQGALPTPESARSKPLQVFRASTAKPETVPDTTSSQQRAEGNNASVVVDQTMVSVARWRLAANRAIPSHEHRNQSEFWYITAGRGEFTVDGATLTIDSNDIVQIPSGILHQLRVTEDFDAVRFLISEAKP